MRGHDTEVEGRYGNGYCKACQKERSLEWYRNNTERAKDNVRKWKKASPRRVLENRLKPFGITADEYDRMLNEQGGVCAICERPETYRGRLAVDHDHVTGKIRGLLCTGCNLALGKIEPWIAQAKVYLSST